MSKRTSRFRKEGTQRLHEAMYACAFAARTGVVRGVAGRTHNDSRTKRAKNMTAKSNVGRTQRTPVRPAWQTPNRQLQ